MANIKVTTSVVIGEEQETNLDCTFDDGGNVVNFSMHGKEIFGMDYSNFAEFADKIIKAQKIIK